MGHRLELTAKALAIERVATGALAALAPDRAVGAIATEGSDSEAARYLARLVGIRQVVLGVMLWQSRGDRAWLRRMATLNALTVPNVWDVTLQGYPFSGSEALATLPCAMQPLSYGPQVPRTFVPSQFLRRNDQAPWPQPQSSQTHRKGRR